jgi:molybdopterin converting factor small subunit
MAGEDLVENINEFLKENESELVKGPMALGAIMGALSKHYSGIKEELVLREGKKYRLAEKYKPMISEIKTRFESSKQTVDR